MADKKTAGAKPATKSETYMALATATGLTRKQVASVFDELAKVVKHHLGKKGAGVFTLPGLLKIKRVYKPPTKARKGINPFTKEPTVFKAKPARKIVRARPVKAAKDAVA